MATLLPPLSYPAALRSILFQPRTSRVEPTHTKTPLEPKLISLSSDPSCTGSYIFEPRRTRVHRLQDATDAAN